MKKIYMFALPIVFGFIANSASAQTTITFEDLTLPGVDTAWFGIDQSGGFTSNGLFFENTYTTSQWGDYWSSGFIYSNATDVTTPGSSNDYSSYAGTGSNSSKYALNYGGSIDFGAEKIVSSIDITNTTYAGLSMLNGDSFGKQFGSVNDANGDPDGTNGEDWFRLLIIGLDGNSAVTDTVVFYLADYRFADNSQDYILNTWESVDLSPLGQVQFLEFALESSDVGQWGMNTPAYFALDNLSYDVVATEELNQTAYSVYPNPASTEITFAGVEGEISIYNTYGQLVAAEKVDGKTTIDISALAVGTYTYKVVSASTVAAGKFVKK